MPDPALPHPRTEADPMAALRAATRDDHARIESLLRLDAPMPAPRYADIVGGFATWLSAWEPRVRAALPERLRDAFDGRRRGPFAASDVRWLREHRGLRGRLDGAQQALALRLDGPAQALGSMYVIEGAALGARVILPVVETTLGLGADGGADYFRGFGERQPALWRDFRAQVAREVAPDQVQSACHAARETFASLLDVFATLDAAPPADPNRC